MSDKKMKWIGTIFCIESIPLILLGALMIPFSLLGIIPWTYGFTKFAVGVYIAVGEEKRGTIESR